MCLICTANGTQWGLMAKLTIEQLDRKIKHFSKEQIQAVRRAMIKGSQVLVKEMRSQYGRVLNKRTEKLYKAIQRLLLKASATGIQLEVGIGVKQRYKAVTHEMGATRVHPGGVAYFIGSDGRPIFVRKELKARYPWLPKTKSYTIHIPRRPFVEPTQRAKLDEIKELILDEAMKAYEQA